MTSTTSSQGVQRLVSKLKSFIPKKWKQRYFCYFHVAYYILAGFFSGLFIFIIEIGHSRIEFIDAIFMAFSALCVCGLSVVDVSQFSVASKVITLLLMIFGNELKNILKH